MDQALTKKFLETNSSPYYGFMVVVEILYESLGMDLLIRDDCNKDLFITSLIFILLLAAFNTCMCFCVHVKSMLL